MQNKTKMRTRQSNKKTVLVIGGTRFFGIPMIEKLIKDGYDVTIATRGMTADDFGDEVRRIKLNIYEPQSVKEVLQGKQYDVVIDKMGYGSLDVKSVLDVVECEHFIHMSTAGVYEMDHFDIKEEEYDPHQEKLVWCTRGQYDYDFTKRMAEAAIVQAYPGQKYSIIRSPFVLGKNDYTKRLEFYVNHIAKQMPMDIDNMEQAFCVANADSLGKFMAKLVETDGVGIINYCSDGQITVAQIVQKAETMLQKKAILSATGERAPYNGTRANSLSTEKVKKLGFEVDRINTWMDDLIEYYVNQI